MQTLIKTLDGQNGELYAIAGDRRILLAGCTLRVELYDHSTQIPLLGAQSYRLKTGPGATLLCKALKPTREIDEALLRTASRFELIGDFWRTDGIFERIFLHDIVPDTLDLMGDWSFSLAGNGGTLQKLLAL